MKNHSFNIEAKLKKRKKFLFDKNIIKDLKKKLSEASTQAEEDKEKIRLVEEML